MQFINNSEIRYLKLTDSKHKGEILKQVGHKFYNYSDGNWIECGFNMGYFLPDAPEFECYSIITEKDAYKILGIK